MTHSLHHPPDPLTFPKAILPAQPVKIDALTPARLDPVHQASDSSTPATMVIRFLCLHCGIRLSVPAEKVGKWVRCKACEHRVKIPNLPPEPGQPRMTVKRIAKRIDKRRRHRRSKQSLRTSTPLVVPSSSISPQVSAATLPLSASVHSSISAPLTSTQSIPQPLTSPAAKPPRRDHFHRWTGLIADHLRSLLVERTRQTSSSPLPALSIWTDMIVLGIVAGGVWWALVARSGMDLPWMAMLPGLLVGLAVLLRKAEALPQRWRPALAISGVAIMLTLVLILGTTQQSIEVRKLREDVRLVQHAVILDMLDKRTLPAAMQQEIDTRRWYNPQDPESFFSADIIPIYESLKALAQTSINQMSRGELDQILGKFLWQQDAFWTTWSHRLERVSIGVGLWGLLGMGLAGGLPLLRAGAFKQLSQ